MKRLRIWRPRSLFTQILLVGITPTVLLFLALFSYSLGARLSDAKQYQIDIGHRTADNIAAVSELALISGNDEQLEDILQSVMSDDLVAISVYDIRNQRTVSVVNDSQRHGTIRIDKNIVQRQVPVRDAITGEILSTSGPSETLGTVSVALSDATLLGIQRQIALISSAIALLSFLLCGLLAAMISRRLSRPLTEVQSVTKKIAGGDTQARIHAVGDGELGELQAHINSMAESIAHQRQSLEQHVKELEVAKAGAEEANNAKSLFLATMTHELRTPMNGALGMLQLLAGTPLNKEQQEYVAIARTSSEHLLDIVNDILDFSKIEKGEVELEEAYFCPADLLGQMLEPLRLEADRKGLEFTVDSNEDLEDIEILGDETRCRQVLINLCSNAVKFTHNGSVEVALSGRIHADNRVDLTLEVTDTGIGIAPEHLPHIFDRFRQADSATTRQYGGSGLGLAIVHRICELIGGDIDVRSELGSGSRFTLHWQTQCRPRQAPRIGNNEQQVSLSGQKALVVEDNPINQMLVASTLRKAGMSVSTANHGAEALDILNSEPVDIVLMDLQMPVMDGFAATQAIRKTWSKTDLPILALTANNLESDQKRCFAVGMNDFLIKPVTLASLKKKIALQLKLSS